MNIIKASQLLDAASSIKNSPLDPEINQAMRLGMHALKRFALARSYGGEQYWSVLPGEDK